MLPVGSSSLVSIQGAPVAKKKKSRKYDDYVDLGAGYDETDPFIDNTDAVKSSIPFNYSSYFVYILFSVAV